MKRWGQFWGVILFILGAITIAKAESMTLSREAETKFTIVLAADAIEPEQQAARELRRYLKKVTGAHFPIRIESEVDTDAPQILVGQSQRLKDLLPDIEWPALASDAIVVRTGANKLFLAGGRRRGTLYAVYSFLEDTIGCRWWTSTEEYVPRKATLKLPPLNVTYTPKLIYPLFASRLKLNGHFNQIPQKHGGHYSIIGWSHLL